MHILKTVFGEDWKEKIKIIFAGDDVTGHSFSENVVFPTFSKEVEINSF